MANVNKVIVNGETIVDLTSDTVTPETLLEGSTAHDSSGASITGKINLSEFTKSWNGIKPDETGDIKVEIGGRNFLANSDILFTRTSTDTKTYSNRVHFVSGLDYNDFIGKRVTFSYSLYSPGDRKLADISDQSTRDRFGCYVLLSWENALGDRTNTYIGTSRLNISNVTPSRIAFTSVINPPIGYPKFMSMDCVIEQMARPADGNDAVWRIGHPKFELGNVATDWTPAPEDKQDKDDVLLLAYEQACNDRNEEDAAEIVRKIRNNLLDESDKEMTLDRVGLDSSSMTGFIASLSDIFSGKWAKYRQELRDLPDQEGFPFDVTFPIPPNSEELETDQFDI